MFLKLLVLVFLLGSTSSASVEHLVSKLGSQFSHTVRESAKSIKDITKTMSNAIHEVAHSAHIMNKTGQGIPHVIEAHPNQAENLNRNLHNTDWHQLIDIRMDKSTEESIPTENNSNVHAVRDVLEVLNPISILQKDEENVTSNVDVQKQSQSSQLPDTDEKISHFVPNLDSRIVFNDEVSNSKPPFQISLASETPIEFKGVGASRIPGHFNSPQTVDELLSQQNTHNTIKYSREHSSSTGTFEHKSSTVQKSVVPQIAEIHQPITGNHNHGTHRGNSIETQNELKNFAPGNAGLAGLLKHSTADKSVVHHNSYQAIKHSAEDTPFLGLFKYHSIPSAPAVHYPTTSSHYQGLAGQQNVLHNSGLAGVDKQNVCSHGHHLFEPTSYGHSNPVMKPITSEDTMVNDFGIAAPALIILTQQFTPMNVLWDRLLLLKRHHIPMVVYNLHPGVGGAEHREFLHNRASFPESEVASTEMPSSTVQPSTEISENGDVKKEGSVTVSAVMESTGRNTSDPVIDGHGKDRQTQDFSITPRNQAAEPDTIIFEDQ